ncbi:MAG TPA: hypothetical protein VD816_00745 [Ohtaekwangia sp.]|nr:hypothetical protein [Ohtaekwangia sp.]
MHEIEPYYSWLKYYNPAEDERSPFFGKEYNYDRYSETIYGYYIDPAWDGIGSETLYVKILYTDYTLGFTIIEFIGEWNDAINNDIMTLKRSLIEPLIREGISKFILIGENILNFHGSDDSYYEEWLEDILEATSGESEGWIAAVMFPEFVMQEMKKFHVDHYVNMGEPLQLDEWRTLQPIVVYDVVNQRLQRRLS